MSDTQKQETQSIPEKPKPKQKLVPARLQYAESALRIFSFVPEKGTPYERILDGDYYAHVASKLEISNLIQAEAEDGSWWALLLVRMVSGPEVMVTPLIEKRFDQIKSDEIQSGNYIAEFAGRYDKWRVVRASDGFKMKTGLSSKVEALKWIVEHEKAMAA